MSIETERAWAAGFFDGEGTTFVNNTLALTVAQKDQRPLFRFQVAMGGLGQVRGPYREKCPISRFQSYGGDAQRCLMLIWPYLCEPKKHQGMTALVRYWCRTVNDPTRCRRGHSYADVGVYVDPRGRRECLRCRDDRRHGKLPAIVRPTAYEIGLGHRSYRPPAQVPREVYAEMVIET